jgi:hypothetical protein
MIKVPGYPAHMTSSATKVALRNRALRSGFASLAALVVATAAAHAEDCIDVQSSSAIPDYKPCASPGYEVDQSELNSIILESPQPKPKKKAAAADDSVPWIATDTNDVPATFTTSDTGVSVKTSLGTVREFNARSASPAVEQPEFGQAPKTDFSMPQAPVTQKTPVDVWTTIDVNGYDGEKDQSTRTGLGADYKLDKTTTVGVSIERGDAHSFNTPGVTQDQKASAYVNYQATPLLSLDARTEWQTGNSEFAASSGADERSAVILAPKINHDFKLDDGAKLSPYVSYQRQFDVSASRKDGVDPTLNASQSAGAGVTYTLPDSYSLSVSADVDNFGVADEAQSLSSKFQLSVPLNTK